jgi:hypothetical protein
MNNLVCWLVPFLMVPALHAQQAETKGQPPQAESQAQPAVQPAAQSSNGQENLPASIRPGHPLDPADVDVLTGKKDRGAEAARRAAMPVMLGDYGAGYGAYGDYYGLSGRIGTGWEIPELPLTRITNPFFFFGMPPLALGRGGLRGRR